jgi:hypothetical protein
MNELLKLAVEAHGGLDRWNQFKTLKARISVTGALWQLRGQPNLLNDLYIESHLHEQKMKTRIISDDTYLNFDKGLVAVETKDGHVLDARGSGRSAFDGQTRRTPWDKLHLAYFNSYALWNYLTIPFLFTRNGFITEELTPWLENGEEWRCLKVTFPVSVVTHTRDQMAYFGEDGLLRRQEYAVDVAGGAIGLNYAYEYRNVGGIMVPTKRRVYAPDAQKQKIPEPVLVAIGITDIEFKAED